MNIVDPCGCFLNCFLNLILVVIFLIVAIEWCRFLIEFGVVGVLVEVVDLAGFFDSDANCTIDFEVAAAVEKMDDFLSDYKFGRIPFPNDVPPPPI